MFKQIKKALQEQQQLSEVRSRRDAVQLVERYENIVKYRLTRVGFNEAVEAFLAESKGASVVTAQPKVVSLTEKNYHRIMAGTVSMFDLIKEADEKEEDIAPKVGMKVYYEDKSYIIINLLDDDGTQVTIIDEEGETKDVPYAKVTPAIGFDQDNKDKPEPKTEAKKELGEDDDIVAVVEPKEDGKEEDDEESAEDDAEEEEDDKEDKELSEMVFLNQLTKAAVQQLGESVTLSEALSAYHAGTLKIDEGRLGAAIGSMALGPVGAALGAGSKSKLRTKTGSINVKNVEYFVDGDGNKHYNTKFKSVDKFKQAAKDAKAPVKKAAGPVKEGAPSAAIDGLGGAAAGMAVGGVPGAMVGGAIGAVAGAAKKNEKKNVVKEGAKAALAGGLAGGALAGPTGAVVGAITGAAVGKKESKKVVKESSASNSQVEPSTIAVGDEVLWQGQPATVKSILNGDLVSVVNAEGIEKVVSVGDLAAPVTEEENFVSVVHASEEPEDGTVDPVVVTDPSVSQDDEGSDAEAETDGTEFGGEDELDTTDTAITTPDVEETGKTAVTEAKKKGKGKKKLKEDDEEEKDAEEVDLSDPDIADVKDKEGEEIVVEKKKKKAIKEDDSIAEPNAETDGTELDKKVAPPSDSLGFKKADAVTEADAPKFDYVSKADCAWIAKTVNSKTGSSITADDVDGWYSGGPGYDKAEAAIKKAIGAKRYDELDVSARLGVEIWDILHEASDVTGASIADITDDSDGTAMDGETASDGAAEVSLLDPKDDSDGTELDGPETVTVTEAKKKGKGKKKLKEDDEEEVAAVKAKEELPADAEDDVEEPEIPGDEEEDKKELTEAKVALKTLFSVYNFMSEDTLKSHLTEIFGEAKGTATLKEAKAQKLIQVVEGICVRNQNLLN